jgi:Ni,Fe-hydrogenase III small subunit/ferredoxin-like protein FixX
MTKWVFKGLQTGIKTTAYPKAEETAVGVSPGRPAGMQFAREEEARAVASLCPTNAVTSVKDEILVDQGRCIHCFRCKREEQQSISWEEDYEWADFTSEGSRLERPFYRSLHIRIVDAGACAACMSEIKQISSPYYNIHRLGFFITPTPRAADVLLVAGPLTDHMRLPLKKCYEAVPQPKRVIAVGTCALSGGIFGPSFAASAGVCRTVSVDIQVPGCPPPPLAILHALLMAAGRSEKGQTKGRA